ncbi:MAG: DUF1905 domain-containing protein [Solirubrobacterales bacterium]|nr:DUF1905 domain-containing protein [Solirubrobacterales bacterium]
MQFPTTIELSGKSATGVCVPDEIVQALGGGNRPAVRVTLAGYTYRTTVARMHGKFMFPVSAAVRAESGLAAGDEVSVEIELDDAPRTVTIPPVLAAALDRHPEAKTAFERLSHTNQKRHVLAIEGAKTEQTRERRLEKTLAELRGEG